MGRKVLLVCCWLAIGQSLADDKSANNKTSKTVTPVAKDNESAESVPRLYPNFPMTTVYAAPYGAYSFQAPSFVSPGAGPVKAESFVIPTGYLKNVKDSYGKFISPQTVPFKPGFSQQYVQLQALPAHLSQPLLAAPSYQYKSPTPHFFGQQYGAQSYQQAPTSFQQASISYQRGQQPTPTPLTSFKGFSQPFVYAGNIKSFAPSNFQTYGYPTETQSASYTTTANSQQLEPRTQTITLQRVEDNPNENKGKKVNKEKELVQAAQATRQTGVTAVVNGKKTVINIETKPPLPLLDLNLLEPLQFDNPLVPQIQHFLPKISEATYSKLPQFDINEAKKLHKEIIIKNIKSYDGPIKGKAYSPSKNNHNKPRKPSVTVHGSVGSPELSYEINTPNHKETYNEQVISYNSEMTMKPVVYSYSEKTNKEPEVYSFVHSSKEPLKVTHIEYDSERDGPNRPKDLVYKTEHEEQDEDDNPRNLQDSEDSGEPDDDGPSQPLVEHNYDESHNPSHNSDDAPRSHHSHSGGHPRSHHHQSNGPSSSHHHSDVPSGSYHQHHHHHSDGPTKTHYHSEKPPSSYHHSSGVQSSEHHQSGPSSSHHHHSNGPTITHHNSYGPHHSEVPPKFYVFHSGPSQALKQPQPHNGQHHSSSSSQGNHGSSQRQEVPREQQHQKGHDSSKQQEYHHKLQGINQEVHPTPQQYYFQPITVTLQDDYQPITQKYGNIKIVPTNKPHANKPHANIKVDPNQHVQYGPSTPRVIFLSSTQKLPQQESNDKHGHSVPPFKPINGPYKPAAHIQEKSKRVIIKEEEEVPGELHTHMEQAMAELSDQEENSEEDFEKAYKESAFGFPAYEESSDDTEKEIYNPEFYGVPKQHDEYNIRDSPFEQYQEEGDEFPKSLRAAYKDTRDSTKEDYFLDYSVNKPESFIDRHKNKVDYYKAYKKNRPEKIIFAYEDNKKKPKKSEKYVAAPSFDFPSSSYKPKPKQYFAQYKAAPIKYEYNYSKEAPRDTSAFASRPFHKYKTHFVEPPFQYGFEPLAAPIIVDSELSAMASNFSPESEKPGTRKKIYKENFYIKKTSTTAGKPS